MRAEAGDPCRADHRGPHAWATSVSEDVLYGQSEHHPVSLPNHLFFRHESLAQASTQGKEKASSPFERANAKGCGDTF